MSFIYITNQKSILKIRRLEHDIKYDKVWTRIITNYFEYLSKDPVCFSEKKTNYKEIFRRVFKNKYLLNFEEKYKLFKSEKHNFDSLNIDAVSEIFEKFDDSENILLLASIRNKPGKILFGYIKNCRNELEGNAVIQYSWAIDYLESFGKFIGANISKFSKKEPPTKKNIPIHPNWWPKTDKSKLKFRSLYPKIKPLYYRKMNFTQIAKELDIDRHEVPHILRWFQMSSEAHGK